MSHIRDLREDCDLTQQNIADYFHCSQSLYAYYESGKRNLPADNLIALAKLYNVSTDYILELTNNPSPK
ncbi:MAG: helix-turn-helix transcriptional regulator [Selenomonadaceae bacterium]|nr:helix-turn-helix transcriptional regulator [Selenomonadaceae bacterium]